MLRREPVIGAIGVIGEGEPSLGLVWRRLRRLDIDRRNDVEIVEIVESDDGGSTDVTIACGNAVHRASVTTSGCFDLHDHDVAAELAMIAFGAAVPACLLYAAVWDDGLGGDRFLRAWADDVEGDRLQAAREDWLGNYWEYWPTDPAAARVLFGSRLQRSLAMAALARVAAEADAGSPSRVRVLVRATQTRARRAFVRSLAFVEAHRRPDALVPVRIGVGVSAPPSVGGRLSQDGSSVELRLPVDWLWAVWDPGLAVVGGRFVVAHLGDVLLTVAWRPTGRGANEHEPVLEPLPVPPHGVASPAEPSS